MKTQEHEDRIVYPEGFKVLMKNGRLWYVLHKKQGTITQDDFHEVQYTKNNGELISVTSYDYYRELKVSRGIDKIFNEITDD